MANIQTREVENLEGSEGKTVAGLQAEVNQLTILWADTLQKVCTLERTTKQVADTICDYIGAWKSIKDSDQIFAKQRSKVIYLAGPYTAKTKEQVELNCLTAQFEARVVFSKGHTPIVPHTNFVFADPNDWRGVMNACLDLIHRVDAVLMLPNWETSLGARCERYAAYATGRTVYYSTRDIPDALYKPDPIVLEEMADIED